MGAQSRADMTENQRASKAPLCGRAARGLAMLTVYYVAVWQNKAFMVILAILNIDPAAAKKAALAENARIK